MNNDSNNSKPSAFQLLCQAGVDKDIDFKAAVAIDAAIKSTPQGFACINLIEQYNQGLITFAEFRNAFVTAALS